MYPAARAYDQDIFFEHMAAIKCESQEVVKWLTDYHNLLWYRCAFNPDIKCDYITNNIAEVLIIGYETLRTYLLLNLLIRFERLL